MCGRKTSSNTARASLFCTTGTDACCWADKRSEPSGRFPNKTSLSPARQKFDRCTDKGVVMFSTQSFSVLWVRSLHDDFSDHMRMESTEVVEGAGAGERIGKRIVSIERLRPECLVLVDHYMRDIVTVQPLHRRSHGNG